MISANFSNLSKFLLALLCGAAVLAPFQGAQAQQDPGYAPPPMFDDMTPPMVRPQGQDGYLVTPKASPNTQLPAPTPQRAPVIIPRVSVDPDSVRPVPAPSTRAPSPAPEAPPAPPVKPVAPVAPPAVIAPAKPEAMKPIVEETYIKREKATPRPQAPKKSGEEPRTEAVGRPKAPPSPSIPGKPAIPPSDSKAPPPPSAEAPVIAPVKRDPKESAI